MKVTFIGTGHGAPTKERYCQCILIENGEDAYIVDAGAPLLDVLLRMDFDLKRLKGIFITHMHGDHFFGLPNLTDPAGWFYEDVDVDIYLPEKDLVDAYRKLYYLPEDSKRIRLKTSAEGTFYEKNGMKVTAFPNGHMTEPGRPSYGFLLEADGQKIYISGDLNQNGELDYSDIVNEEPTDLFIVECMHCGAEALIEKLNDCQAKTVAFVHVYPESRYELLKEVQEKEDRYQVLLPKDGDVFEL